MRKTLSIAFGALAIAAVAAAEEHATTGEVTKVDAPAGKITVRHGPIQNLDMGSMTMVFRVKEPTMLDTVKTGDKVIFEADRIEGRITITRIEKIK